MINGRRLFTVTLWAVILTKISSNPTIASIEDGKNCYVSSTGEFSVPDCNCSVQSVNNAVENMIVPILGNLTSRRFFRYFLVDLEKPCPFWNEERLCMQEGCSVCPCGEEEIPEAWRAADSENTYGWITSSSAELQDGSIARVDLKGSSHSNSNGVYMKHLEETEDCNAWTVFNDRGDSGISTITSYFQPETEPASPGVYVNLLNNPERFTGYSGPSARRVWRAIQEENCFGENDDSCLEKRIFFRLMSGLQSSISTHIAREYLYPMGHWGINRDLFRRAVSAHSDRLHNMYFSFLFLLRAVVKAGDVLKAYPFNTGNSTDDLAVRRILHQLVSSSVGQEQSLLNSGFREEFDSSAIAVEECKHAFDESYLFQVSESLSGPQYWHVLEDKQQLREEFKLKFRNISRIMDCVSCERCRVWGKLQILGLGTAVKILLTPQEDLMVSASHYAEDLTCPLLAAETRKARAESNQVMQPKMLLNRQEIIALINTLHQFSKSIQFAAEDAKVEAVAVEQKEEGSAVEGGKGTDKVKRGSNWKETKEKGLGAKIVAYLPAMLLGMAGLFHRHYRTWRKMEQMNAAAAEKMKK